MIASKLIHNRWLIAAGIVLTVLAMAGCGGGGDGDGGTEPDPAPVGYTYSKPADIGDGWNSINDLPGLAERLERCDIWRAAKPLKSRRRSFYGPLWPGAQS